MIDYSTYKDSDLLALLNEPKPVCEDAFQEIFYRYSNRLNAYCKNKVSNSKQSEDIFQDTWIEFFKASKDKGTITNLKSFLLKIAHNLIFKYKEKNKKENKLFIKKGMYELDGYRSHPDFQQSQEYDELVSIIKYALNNLDEKYQEVFILKKFNDLTYKEIAELLGETEDCIRQRFSRASRMLKEFLKQFKDQFNH
jgi:RNA polymerase sigma factor (sigma-70 family)